ncbi:hypothetical protein MO973_19595 [Paenibacillus sp. TRM 82003]|nr:hypothetical protein [Paenibacillus sp. TRM 82003]
MPKPIEPELKEQIRAYLSTNDNVRETARHFGVSPATVMKIRDEKPDVFEHMRTFKKQEFIERGWRLAGRLYEAMEDKIPEATFKDLATGFGIVVDKMQLISGEPTSRSDNTNKNTHDLGELTAEQAEELVKAWVNKA